MQMYAVVATGVLGLLIGFWSGRSIRWNMEETEEEAVNRQEERKITGEHGTTERTATGQIRTDAGQTWLPAHRRE